MVSPSRSPSFVCFVARVVESQREFLANIEVSLTEDGMSHFFVGRTRPRKGAANSVSTRSSQYSVSLCTGVTPRPTVVREHTMIVHFDSPSQKMLMVRAWPSKANRDVMDLWAALNSASIARSTSRYNKAVKSSHARSSASANTSSSRKHALRLREPAREGTNPEDIRERERNRFMRECFDYTGSVTPKTRRRKSHDSSDAITPGSPKKARVRTMKKRGRPGKRTAASRRAPLIVASPAKLATARSRSTPTEVATSLGPQRELNTPAASPSESPPHPTTPVLNPEVATVSPAENTPQEEHGLPYANPWLVDGITADTLAALVSSGNVSLVADRPRTPDPLDDGSGVVDAFSAPTAGEELKPVVQGYQHQGEDLSSDQAGITNTGNTCYLAAVTQTLLTDKVFVQNLRHRYSALGRNMSRPLTTALIDLMDDQAMGRTMCVDDLRDAIGKYMPSFANKEEQDVHEFITGVLTLIESELGNDLRTCPVSQSFGLVEKKVVACAKCGMKSTARHELVRHLTVSIPEVEPSGVNGTHSLSELVNDYYKPEKIERSCESCSGKMATITSNVVVAPRVLLVHLNRIRLDSDFMISKVSDRVDIPDELELKSSIGSTWMSHEDLFLGEPASLVGTSSSELGDTQESAAEVAEDAKKSPESGKKRSRRDAGSESPASPKKRPRVPELSPVNIDKRILVGRPTRVPSPVTTPTDTPEDIKAEGTEQIPPAKAEVPADGLGLDQRAKVQELQDLGVDYQIALSVLQETHFDVLAAAPRALDRQRLIESPSEQLVRKTAEWAIKNDAKKCNVLYSLRGIIRHRGSTQDSGHYVADIVQEDGTWLSFNDSNIYPLTREGERRQLTESYLMYYVQK